MSSSLRNAKLEWGVVWYFPSPIVKFQLGLKFSEGIGTNYTEKNKPKRKEKITMRNKNKDQVNQSKTQRATIIGCMTGRQIGAFVVLIQIGLNQIQCAMKYLICATNPKSVLLR